MQATASARLTLKRTHSRVACPHNPELVEGEGGEGVEVIPVSSARAMDHVDGGKPPPPGKTKCCLLLL